MNALIEYENRLRHDVADFYLDPLGFVLYAFPWGEDDLAEFDGPDVWQRDFLGDIGRSLRENPNISLQEAIASGHGIGKSAVTAWVILWAMSTRPNLNGIITANTGAQLTTKTWRELAVWHKRAINRHWFRWTATKFFQIEHPETWFTSAIPNTEHNSEAFAGQHAEHVLIIYDEASAIPDRIWEVSEGAMTTPGALWCVFGNPTRNSGRFRECFGKFKHRWRQRKVDSRTAKMTDKRKIQQWIDDYGEDSDFVRVRVRGEFPSAGSNQFIARAPVMECMRYKAEGFAHAPKVLACDVARFGDDQTVMGIRQGRKAFAPKKFRGLDTMQTAGHLVQMIQEHNPHAVVVDEVGIGAGVVDRLRQLGYSVIGFNGGHRPVDPAKYANRRAEVWAAMRDAINAGMELPPDEEMTEELTAVEYAFTAKQQIALEKKEDMKERGLSSPDVADWLSMTFAVNPADVEDDYDDFRRNEGRSEVAGY